MHTTIREEVSLSDHTTFGIGGSAEYFATASSIEELTALVNYANQHNLSVHVIGGGSNLLVSDDGVKGLTIKNEIKGINVIKEDDDSVVFDVGAGESWDDLVSHTTVQSLWGFENLSGIPGTVGGAVVQNINAYGVTIADMVDEVLTIHIPTGRVRHFQPSECKFEYRNSFFKQSGEGKEYVVVMAKFRLSKVQKLHSEYRSSSQSIDVYLKDQGITTPQPSDIREAIIFIRSRIGMIGGMYKSAGSFFKNPIITNEEFANLKDIIEIGHKDVSSKFTPWHWSVGDSHEKISAAFLMECTPFNKTNFADKSYNGTVGISPVHTLSIINKGGAKSEDVKSFVHKISGTVKEKFKIELESEVCFL